MAADSSTLADEYIASPHRNSNGTEDRLNIELPDHPLSSKGPVETEEPAPAVRTHVEEIAPVMADNVDATVPVPPAPTPMSTDAAPTPMSECETQFRVQLAMRGLPDTKANLCRVALDAWQSGEESLGKQVGKTEKEIHSTTNEIYQVVGFYSAFQGFLLTAIAQSTLLHWNNRGYPLALSAFSTGIAAIGVVQKHKVKTDLKETLANEDRLLKAFIDRVDRLRTEGVKFPFKDVYEDIWWEPKPQTKLNKLFSFLLSDGTLFMATLITFGALFVASMLQILRHPGIRA